MNVRFLVCVVAMFGGSFGCALTARAQTAPAHGLWVWKSTMVLAQNRAAETLRDFCRANGVNEVYVSVPSQPDAAQLGRLAHVIDVLHRSNIRVEALLESENADEPGKHRDKLLDHVRAIVEFNRAHPQYKFDGVHLDIEPQQRPENKGPGNLRFLPGLVDAYRDARKIAEAGGMTINADIQNKLLKGDLNERRTLMTALPRLTLMLYEVSSAGDGDTLEQRKEKLRAASAKFLAMAYDGLPASGAATMTIGLRTPDYGDQLPAMLASLDKENGAYRHYAGWARHAYNDVLGAAAN
jgi:hypothetical protein